MKNLFRLSLLVLLSFTAFESHAVTRSWTNTAGGNWFVTANWSPNGVPTGIDVANITNNGTYTVTILTGAVTVASVNLGAASGTQTLLNGTANNLFLTNTSAVRANGVLTITNGGLEGRLTVQPGGQLLFSGAAAKNVYRLTLNNQGTVTWSGGTLQAGSSPPTVISNGGLWQMTGDDQIYQAFGGPAMSWTNSGTLRKSAGSGVSQIQSFNFVNLPGGIVDTDSGTLQFTGGSSSLGGSFTTTTLMNIASGIWTDSGGTMSGTGTNRFNGGTLNLRTNIIPGLRLTGGDVFVTGTNSFQQAGAITNLTLDGSQLQGTNRIGNGTLTINSGGAEGRLTVQAGGQLQLLTSTVKNVYRLFLINQGTVNWSAGTLQAGSTPPTVISNGGLWQMTGDDQIYQAFGGPAMSWTNGGTLRKSAGSGISHIQSFNFINLPGGIVDTDSGTLQFSGGMNVLGGFFTTDTLMNIASGIWTDSGGIASGGGTNRFNGGTLNLRTNIIPGLGLNGGDIFVTGTSTFQQAGAITNLTLDGSQLQGTNRIGNGTLTINSGGAEGQLTVQPGGQLLFTNSPVKNVYRLHLINQGTVNWRAGTLQAGSTPPTVISNGGLWQMTSDDQIYQAFGGPAMSWNNTGTLRKSAGSGISHIQSFNFINASNGLVDALSGTLQFSGGNNVLGGSFTAATLINIASGIWTDSGGTTSGAGTNRFNGGTLNLRTNIIPGLRLTGGDVFVTGTNTFQQAGAITNLTLDGSQLQGTNRVGNGTLIINAGGAEGQLTVQAGGQLQFLTSAVKNVYRLFLINQGTVNWSAGILQAGSTPPTIISNGGLWQVTGDDTLYQAFGGPAMSWTNAGTLRKSGGTGVSQISSFNFVNSASGLVQADTGILQLPSPITNSTGTLRLNGGTIQSGGTYGMSGGTLEGAGAFGANAITGGLVTPGQAGPGLIGFRSGLNLGASATLTLSGTGTTPGTQYDQLSVTGAVSLANATLQVTSLPPVAPGTTFILILNDGTDTVAGTFNGLAENAIVNVSGQPFRIRYTGGSGNDVTLVRDSGSASAGPLLTSTVYTNGAFRLFATGSNAVIYGVQATTNFIQWTNIGFATGGVGGTFTFADSNAFRYRYRFYRTTN